MAIQRPDREYPPQHEVVEPVARVHETAQRSSVRVPFGASQGALLLMGILYVAVSAIGLARTQLDNWTVDPVTVGPFSMTTLLAVAMLAVGVLGLAGSAARGSARSMCMFLGPLLIAGGIVVLVQTIESLGTVRADGVLFLMTGIVALAAAMMTPAVVQAEERSVTIG